jgi:hypothetical protein
LPPLFAFLVRFLNFCWAFHIFGPNAFGGNSPWKNQPQAGTQIFPFPHGAPIILRQDELFRNRGFNHEQSKRYIITMETKNMSANPHSIVHARQYNDVEKCKPQQDEQAPRKAEPSVKGVVCTQKHRKSFCGHRCCLDLISIVIFDSSAILLQRAHRLSK